MAPLPPRQTHSSTRVGGYSEGDLTLVGAIALIRDGDILRLIIRRPHVDMGTCTMSSL